MEDEFRKEPVLDKSGKIQAIRQGDDFQAIIPNLDYIENAALDTHKADLLYQPDSEVQDEDSLRRILGNPEVVWTPEEKATFKKCLWKHKKKFHRYRESFPEKTLAQLLDYYYSTKKRKGQKPENKFVDPDYSPVKKVTKKTQGRKKLSRREEFARQLEKVDQIEFTVSPKTCLKSEEDSTLNVSIKREIPRKAVSTPWTNSDLILAVHAIRLCGKDFKALSKLVVNKTETQLRLFYNTYRERYNLEALVQLFEQDRNNGIRIDDAGTVIRKELMKGVKLRKSPSLKKPNILMRKKV